MSVTLQQTNHLVQAGTVLPITNESVNLALTSGSLTAGTWLVTGEFELKSPEEEDLYINKLECSLTVDGVQECSNHLASNQTLFRNTKYPYTFNSIVTRPQDFKIGMNIEYLFNTSPEITVKRFIAVKV